jgi:hypothetical protein
MTGIRRSQSAIREVAGVGQKKCMVDDQRFWMPGFSSFLS